MIFYSISIILLSSNYLFSNYFLLSLSLNSFFDNYDISILNSSILFLKRDNDEIDNNDKISIKLLKRKLIFII